MEGQDLGKQLRIRVSTIPPGDVQQDPGIELNMQSLSIHDPQILHIQADQQREEDPQEARYNILMKLAVTGGTPRFLSLQTVQQSMARAWRDNYHGISQLSTYIFVAHFNSLEAAMFVITRQPWSMGSDNFLIEWMDPEDLSKDYQDYKFDTIFVTVRVYGVPPRFRSQELLQKKLLSMGQISEFHPFSQAMIHAKPDYMWGTIRAKVNAPVRDKIWVSFTKNLAAWVFLFYERIGWICTYCGVMFHSVQHCPIRNNILISRQRLEIPLEQIPSGRFGQWMTNVELIPEHLNSAVHRDMNSFSSFLNPQLARLQKQFLESSKGKSKVSENGGSSVAAIKELSLKEVDRQIHRVQQGGSSKDSGLQFQQQQLQTSASPALLAQPVNQGQSTADVLSAGVMLPSPTAVNEETVARMCNNARDSPIQSFPRSSPKRLSGSLPDFPFPPPKRLAGSGDGQNTDGREGGASVTGSIKAAPSSGPQPHAGSGLLGAAHVEGFLHQRPDTSGAVGAAALDVVTAASQGSAGTGIGSGVVSPGAGAVKGSRHRLGHSKWDVPPTGGSGVVRPSVRQIPSHHTASSSCHHHGGSTQMGSSYTRHGGNIKYVASMDLEAAMGQNKMAVAQSEGAGACYDPWPNWSPSGSHTADSDNSRQGPLSPPRVDCLNKLGLDVGGYLHGTGTQAPMEAQDNFSSSCQGDTIHLRDSQMTEEMEFTGQQDISMAHYSTWAAAHGPNAPRAP